MTVLYHPPYDSPIENRFAMWFAKYADDSITLTSQVNASTLCGLFVLDFVLEDDNGYRVGIECDGKEYHCENRDEWRDAMILGGGHIDVIYRLRGVDINYRIEDCLYLLAKLEPSFFSERRLHGLVDLASDEVLRRSPIHKESMHVIRYQNGPDIESLIIEVRRTAISKDFRWFWRSLYEYGLSVGGGHLDDVMLSYREKQDQRGDDFI
ncbi:hypothetical protein HNW13_017795 [Shewanella sp. BF02_Schw]|uniref:hypothetical protein n=1 Tax=Shewanella sp. BF02_Schw TaxID=394908 RepID=UPI001781D825|nr:hypothetical protein [Shewanella sp. BF02_Schw]MBO1897593.1 hypothetical protein [Shewanella sp. BF02_Schw]